MLKKEVEKDVVESPLEQAIKEQKSLDDLKAIRNRQHLQKPNRVIDQDALERELDTDEVISNSGTIDEDMPNLFSFIESDAVMPGH